MKDNVIRAAHLCKADLVSQVVGEFANLQGVMGRIYAHGRLERRTMWRQPSRSITAPPTAAGKLPETETGALLAIAEKIDSICGCFLRGPDSHRCG